MHGLRSVHERFVEQVHRLMGFAVNSWHYTVVTIRSVNGYVQMHAARSGNHPACKGSAGSMFIACSYPCL